MMLQSSESKTDAPQSPLRVAVFASGAGSNLEALLRAQKSLFEICLVVTDRACRSEEVAEAAGIPWWRLDFGIFFKSKDRQNVEDRRAYDRQILAYLRDYGRIDLIVLAGYMRMVSSVLLDAYPHRILNVHPGDLAERAYVGMHAVRDALRDGQLRTRSSIIFVDSTMDGGPVLVSGPWVDYQGGQPITSEAVKLHQRRQKRESDWPAVVYAVTLMATETCLVDDQGRVSVNGKILGPAGIELTKGTECVVL